MKTASIVVLGSSNTDMVLRLPQIPRPGETLLGGQFFSAAGGKGANQAVGAARAGGRVAFIGRVGRDAFGTAARRGLSAVGIDVRHLTDDPRERSGVALIFVSAAGQNSIGVGSGANGAVSEADVSRARGLIEGAAVLLMQLETPLVAVRHAAGIAARSGVRVVLNPAPACRLPADLLRTVSVLTPNETEAEALTGIPVNTVRDAERAAKSLRRRGVKTVVITLGRKGALISDEQGERLVRGFNVKAVDTTAAGDMFNGALAVALAEKRTIDAAVQFANAAGALSVTKLGAQPSAPSRREIAAFLRPHLQ